MAADGRIETGDMLLEVMENSTGDWVHYYTHVAIGVGISTKKCSLVPRPAPFPVTQSKDSHRAW